MEFPQFGIARGWWITMWTVGWQIYCLRLMECNKPTKCGNSWRLIATRWQAAIAWLWRGILVPFPIHGDILWDKHSKQDMENNHTFHAKWSVHDGFSILVSICCRLYSYIYIWIFIVQNDQTCTNYNISSFFQVWVIQKLCNLCMKFAWKKFLQRTLVYFCLRVSAPK